MANTKHDSTHRVISYAFKCDGSTISKCVEPDCSFGLGHLPSPLYSVGRGRKATIEENEEEIEVIDEIPELTGTLSDITPAEEPDAPAFIADDEADENGSEDTDGQEEEESINVGI